MKIPIKGLSIVSALIMFVFPLALANEKFEVIGETLIYDTDRPSLNEEEQEINWDDGQ